jgi:transcriptional regulator with XRE-family HTH domain
MNKKTDMVYAFGKRLIEARQEKNLTQQELAKIVNIAASTMSAYENLNALQFDKGKAPSIYTAYKISEVLGVSLDWICGLSEYKNGNIISLHGIADMIENDCNSWNVLTDVVEAEIKQEDENEPPQYGDELYHVAIVTKDIRFYDFVREYKNALDALNAAQKASKEYKLPVEVFENMKTSILNKHIKIFNADTGSVNNE